MTDGNEREESVDVSIKVRYPYELENGFESVNKQSISRWAEYSTVLLVIRISC